MPGAPAAAPGVPAAPPAAHPQLAAHLNGWQQTMTKVVNLRADFTLTRKVNPFNKETSYTGSVLCMKPNLARLRLVNAANPADFEAFVCNGASVYHYDGLKKSVTDYKIAPGADGADNLMLDFIRGMNANAVQQRFDIALFKEDPHYVYLDIKPRLPKDRQEFDQVRFALYGPATKFAYLPAQVWVLKPNQDTELWKFTNPQTDLPGIEKKHFQFEAPPKDWQVTQAPPPGGPAPPPAPKARP